MCENEAVVSQNPEPLVQSAVTHRRGRDFKRVLKPFLDWLLDPNEWPRRKNADLRRDLKMDLKQIRRTRKLLETLPRTQRSQRLKESLTLVTKEEESVASQLKWSLYRTPHSTIWCDTRQGNIELQRRWFVAYLIFRRGRYDAWFRRFCPTRDAFTNMAEYVKQKGFGPDISSQARKAVQRYRKKGDMPPVQVISSLYGQFLWQTRGQAGYSDEEQRLLQTLVPATTRPSKRPRGRMKKNKRSDNSSNLGATWEQN